MPIANLVVFPLFGIVNGKCACGDPKCGRVGKHPAIKWGAVKLGDAVPKPQPGAGLGLKTGAAPYGSDVFVVDLDSDSAAEAFDTMGECPATFSVSTGKGVHVYFRSPGFPVKNSVSRLAAGIDIRGDGGFVVAPGGPHKSGQTYQVVCDAWPAEAPPWLLERLQQSSPASTVQSYPGDVTGEERTRRCELYAAWLAKEAVPCVEGDGGDGRLFTVVQRGALDMALPNEDVLELIREHYDPRCTPPWGDGLDERVLHKAHDAKTKSTRPRLEPIPADSGHMTTEEPAPVPRLPPVPISALLRVRRTGWTDPLPPMVWTVANTIVRGTVNTWVGDPDALKTWVAMHACVCIASGRPFLGRDVVQGNVALIDYETGEYQTRKRIKILGAHGLEETFSYVFPDIPLVDERLWQELAKWHLAFVVVDSLSRGCPGIDENSPDVAIPYALAKKRLCESPEGTAVTFIHHLNKTGTLRGSTAIRAASDMVFEFTRSAEGGQRSSMSLDRTKVCDRTDVKEFAVELTDARGIESVEVARKESVPARDVDRRVLLALNAAGRAGILGYRSLAKSLGFADDKSRTVLNALLRLEEEGAIYRNKEGRADRWFDQCHEK